MPGHREADLPSIGAFARGGSDSGRAASGATAALAVALATDLVTQVATASTEWDEHGGALAQAGAIRDRALALATELEEAFAAALAGLDHALAAGPLLSSPVTSLDLGASLDLTIDLLLAVAATAGDAATLAADVARAGVAALRADAVAAAMLATAAADIAAHLVDVNLLADDERSRRAAQLAQIAAGARDTALRLGR
jgi:formiminotetrahydrofolate cyclodeaminase